jgi:hypothetical protein
MTYQNDLKMKKYKCFNNEVTNGKACLPSKEQKHHTAGIAVQRIRITMPNHSHFIRQATSVLLTFTLILGLLPGCIAQPDSDDGFEARRNWLLEILGKEGQTYRTDRVEPSQARIYVTNGQDKAALEHLVTVLDYWWEKGSEDHDRHAGPAIVRALFMYGDRFSPDQIGRIKRAVTSKAFHRATAHGTENHAMDFVTFGYLLAQYFPGETWNTTEGLMTSQELMELNRGRILSRGRGFYRVGHSEQLSTTYDQLCVRSSVNLWEFARDPVVRDAGEALTLYHLGLFALNNFDGHIMPPFNRRNRLQARFGSGTGNNGRHTHTGYMAWMLWGQNKLIPPGVAEDQVGRFLRSTGFHQYAYGEDPVELASAFLQTSGLRLPGALTHIALGAGTPCEIRGANGEYSL